MSEIKLLPCPFCDAELKRWDYMPSVFFEHPYNGCILSGKKVLESEHDINAWNTRKPMERILTRLEEKQTEYEKISEQKYFDMPQACYYKGYEEGYKGAIKICKEEGGIE